MGRILKALIVLILFGGIGLAGFAYLGDLEPDRSTITQPVTLDVD